MKKSFLKYFCCNSCNFQEEDDEKLNDFIIDNVERNDQYLLQHLRNRLKKKETIFTHRDLLQACSISQVNMVKKIILCLKFQSHYTNFNFNINFQCGNGWTSLLEASKFVAKNRIEGLKIINLLLNYDADINIPNCHGWTSLLFSVKDTNYELSQLLLKNNADVNCQNTSGYTPIMYACKNYDDITLKMLLKQIPSFAIINKKENTLVWDYLINDSACEDLILGYSKRYVDTIINTNNRYLSVDMLNIICNYLAYY